MGLNKVTYQDLVTVIAALNLNDIQDAIIALEGMLPSIAPEYSVNTSYTPGDYVVYQNVLYKCTSATSGAWNPSKWTAVNFGDEMQAYEESTDAELRSLFADLVESITTEYSATAMYDVGDIVEKDGLIYKCIVPIITQEAWTASHWTAIDLSNEIAEAQRDATEGYSDTLTAGDLTSDEYAEDSEPYLFRRTFGGACNHAMDTLVGGTVAWNQLVQNGNFESTSGWDVNGFTWTVSGNKATIVSDDTTGTNKALNSASINIIENHKYLGCFEITSNVATTNTIMRLYRQNNGSIWFNPVSLQANTKTRYLSILSSDVSNLLRIYIYPDQGTNYTGTSIIENVNLFDLTAMFGSTIADAIYAMEQAESGSGVAWFRKYFPESYYAYDAGTLKSVEAVAHRMVGKNLIPKPTWSSKTASGVTAILLSNGQVSVSGTGTNTGFSFIGYGSVLLPAGSYIFNGQNGVDSAHKLLTLQLYNKTTETQITNKDTGTDYAFTLDAETLIEVRIGLRVGVSVTNAIMSPMIRYADVTDATFKPYIQHTYKLSPLTLRGIPKLSDGKLQYDGDTYEPSGQVVRKYGVVDLGTLTWSKTAGTTSDYDFFTATFYPVSSGSNSSIICPRYVAVDSLSTSTGGDKAIRITNNNYLRVRDLSYNDAETFKTSLSGVYAVYLLGTPTTESASPYEPTQVVYADGTEEYISNNIVPVGHSTKYPVSIKAKIYELIDTVAQLQALVLENISNS